MAYKRNKTKPLNVNDEQLNWMNNLLAGECINFPHLFALGMEALLEERPELLAKYGAYPTRIYKAGYTRWSKDDV